MFFKIRELFEKYERHISSGALLGGFVVDNLTLKRIDFFYDNLVMIFYVVVAGGAIASMNLYRGGVIRGKFFDRVHYFVPIAMQFAFGGLFSAFVIFYSRSASLGSSWPFLLILITLLVGNEFFKERYSRLTFQVSIFFAALFSFSVFFVPVLLRQMGAWVFVLSGILSVAIIAIFLYFLALFLPAWIRFNRNRLVLSIGLIYVAINFLYFMNIIPPIPLSLKDSGFFHLIERTSAGEYRGLKEEGEWFDFVKLRETVHLTANEPVYFWSAVFAPTKLQTKIRHCWDRYDEPKDEWTRISCLEFPIVGGRSEGYRGFSLKYSPEVGLWRVKVETLRGQVIAKETFRVERAVERTSLKEVIL